MTDSRAKGARGETDASRFLESITGLRWERTAQRWGKALPDVWCPAMPDLKLHVEVKLWAGGLTRMVVAARKFGLTLTEDDIYVADAELLPIIMLGPCGPTWDRGQPKPHRAMRDVVNKAASDAAVGHVSIVLFREDRTDWCAAWRYQDDDALIEVLGPLCNRKEHAV